MRLKIFATYREITGCKELELPAPPNVLALLDELALRYGQKMKAKLFDSDGEISMDAIVLVNGRHINHLEGKHTPLTEADIVSLFPMVAGG